MRNVIAMVVALTLLAASPGALGSASPAHGLEWAESILVQYLDGLAAGEYAACAKYVSDNSWAVLRSWNPTKEIADSTGLLGAGCRGNGLKFLSVRTVAHGEDLGGCRFQFQVTFNNADGSQFVRGPCCGATAEQTPPDSVFAYTVIDRLGRIEIAELPPYVP